MGFAKRMTAGNQSHGFFVIHGHAIERFANVLSRGKRIRLAVWSLWVHVDQSHLNSGERILKLPVSRVTLVSQPLAFGSPIDVLLRFPDIFATTGESKRFQTHRLEGNISGQDHQIGPRDLVAVLLLDRPEESTCFV